MEFEDDDEEVFNDEKKEEKTEEDKSPQERMKTKYRGDSAINCLALSGKFEAMKSLLEKGIRVFSKSPSDGGTALHRTAEGGHTECANLLLEYNADIDATNNFGQTSLHIAAENGKFDFVKFLVKRGAKKICQNNCVRCTLCNKMLTRQKNIERRRKKDSNERIIANGDNCAESVGNKKLSDDEKPIVIKQEKIKPQSNQKIANEQLQGKKKKKKKN